MNNPAEAPLYPYPPDYTNPETALAPVFSGLKPFILARSNGTTGSRALIQIWSAAIYETVLVINC